MDGTRQDMINGIMNVYKEKGFTSHDVVAKLRGICKQKKIGHTGTLDPDAEGVLPVCFGNATKLCDMLTDQKKEYEAEFILGVTTDTQDISGTVQRKREVTTTKKALEEAIMSFLGWYDQIPPMYSALKVNGKRLYELAREGKEVERKARKVNILSIDILDIMLPKFRIRVTCSKGTYIRTLGSDIGEKLGCGATMTSLLRTRVGNFKVEDALTLAHIEDLRDANELLLRVVMVESLFEQLRRATVKSEYRNYIDNGNKLFQNQLYENCKWIPAEQIRIYNDDDIFCGIYEYESCGNVFKPVKMFPNTPKP